MSNEENELTAFQSHACIHDLFERWVMEAPGAVAVEFDGGTLTYAALNARANQVAHLLREEGVAPDTRVAMCFERCFDLMIAMLAILKAGGAYVPLDPSHPPARLADMLRDCRPLLILGHEETKDVVIEAARGLQEPPVFIAIELAADRNSANLERTAPGLRPEHLAYVIYTSGSTGTPKGVMVEHRNVVNLLADMTRRLSLVPGDAVPAITPVSFDIAGLELHLPLSAGQRILMAPRAISRDPFALKKFIEREDLAFVQATPSTWHGLLQAGWRSRGASILCGGEPLAPNLARNLLAHTQELWNVYGPTETTIWSTAAKITDASQIAIGRPVSNTQIHLLDESAKPVRQGDAGEICIGGAGVARGYWNRPELTAERFIAGPFADGSRLYRTGDTGRMRSNGEIQYIGRGDAQVKVRGARVELGEVEAALTLDPRVAQCAVVSQPDSSGANRLVAYVNASQGAAPTPHDLRRQLAAQLPEYMMPDLVIVLDRFPLTANGKVDRGALSLPHAELRIETSAADDVASQIALIWSNALGGPCVDYNASFFDLGGNSMLMIAIAAKVQDRFCLEVDLQEFFAEPTIACLARQVSGARQCGAGEQKRAAS